VVEDAGGVQNWERIQPLELGGKELDRRQHMRTLMSTVGLPLINASTPSALVRGILHAFLGMFALRLQRHYANIDSLSGYWNLLQNGWLHRDVSFGNVMLLQDPEQRDPVKKYVYRHLPFCIYSYKSHVHSLGDKVCTETSNNKCSGMIVDGDHAVPVNRSAPSTLSNHRTV
jgi:hypothetical protein